MRNTKFKTLAYIIAFLSVIGTSAMIKALFELIKPGLYIRVEQFVVLILFPAYIIIWTISQAIKHLKERKSNAKNL